MSKYVSPENKFFNKYTIFNIVVVILISFLRNVSSDLGDLIVMLLFLGGMACWFFVGSELIKLECQNTKLQRQVEFYNNKPPITGYTQEELNQWDRYIYSDYHVGTRWQ